MRLSATALVVLASFVVSADPLAATGAGSTAAMESVEVAAPDDGRGPLEGTWAMKEIRVISERGDNCYPDPAPGLFIFGKTYYSMIWMPLTEAPEDFQEVWRPTQEEMATAFGSIIVNSGTYTYTDSTVTTLPIVAKTPEFIGGYAEYNYRVDGDTLWMDMTNAVSHGGVVDPGVGRIRIPLKLVRVE